MSNFDQPTSRGAGRFDSHAGTPRGEQDAGGRLGDDRIGRLTSARAQCGRIRRGGGDIVDVKVDVRPPRVTLSVIRLIVSFDTDAP